MGTALTANQLARGCFVGGANQELEEGEANRSCEPNYQFGASLISNVGLDLHHGQQPGAINTSCSNIQMPLFTHAVSQHLQTSSDGKT